MSEIFESVRQGLTEAIALKNSRCSQAVIHQYSSLDVKSIRRKVGMTQQEFADAFGISVSTLRHWERGDRRPRGPALVLLNVVDRDPEAVLRALRS
jgi:putative transcriptional regulator